MPYLGAGVLVNVDPAHNGGQPLASALVTALNSDGTVNVHVLYNADPPRHLHRPRPDVFWDVILYDTTDPAAANRQGLYGAFWPPESAQSQYRAILDRLENIMAAQDDINAAVATDTSLLQDLTAQTAAVAAAQEAFQAEITSLEGQGVDTSGLVAANQQLAAAQAPLDAAVQALTAASAPAAPATGAPEAGTAGSTQGATSVSAGDAGSAS